MGSNKLIHLGNLAEKALLKRKLLNRDNYVAPRSGLEEEIRRVWARTLSLPEHRVGVNDNFFGLGGHSLLILSLARELNKRLDINVSVSTLFRCNTIAKLAHYLKNNADEKIIIDKSKINKEEEQLLSFAQERLWFIEKYEGGTNAYNIPMVFKLSPAIDLRILEASLKSIVTRHEVLRTIIKEDKEGHGYQLVLDDKKHPLEIKKVKITTQAHLHQELEKAVNHIYDLSKGYPIRVGFY